MPPKSGSLSLATQAATPTVLDEQRSLSVIDPSTRTYVPTLQELEAIFKLAQHAAKSGMAKSNNPDQVFFIMMLGFEVGINPMTALRTIYQFGNGAPTLSSQAMLALIRRSGKAKTLEIPSSEEIAAAKKAVIHSTRTDGSSYTAIFALEEARTAGLIKSGGVWEKYPTDLMFARAVARLGRHLYPDVIGGLTYTTEELYEGDSYEPESGSFSGNVRIVHEDNSVTVEGERVPESPKSAVSATDGEVNDDYGNVFLFTKDQPKNNERLSEFWLEMGIGSKGRVDWKLALEETRAMIGKPLEGFSKLSGYKRPEDFFAAMRDFIEANAKGGKPATPKKFTWTEESVSAASEWIRESFNAAPEILLMAMEHDEISAYANPDALRSAVIAHVIDKQLPALAKTVRYGGKGKPISFVTAIGEISWWEGREKLSEKIGETDYAAYGFSALEEGTKTQFELPIPVSVMWEKAGETGKEYFKANDFEFLPNEIPF